MATAWRRRGADCGAGRRAGGIATQLREAPPITKRITRNVT
jgi:hypothetical protein